MPALAFIVGDNTNNGNRVGELELCCVISSGVEKAGSVRKINRRLDVINRNADYHDLMDENDVGIGKLRCYCW